MTYFVQSTAAARLGRELVAAGFGPFVGVRCATPNPLHEALDVIAGVLTVPREDNAIGIAVGAALAGGQPVVLLSDSGPCVAADAILSAVVADSVPVLLVVGAGEGGKAAPTAMFRMSERVLAELGVQSVPLVPAVPPDGPVAGVRGIVRERRRPAALLVSPGVCDGPLLPQHE